MLSKSQYTQYKHCPKHWWLSRRKKEVLAPPSEALQTIFERGLFIGQVAREQFPGGVLVENAWQNPQAAVKRTQELMAQGVHAIYEAAFIYNGIFILADILEKTPSGWNLIEVKSSGISIDVIYWDDISIQNYVLSKCGLKVEHCYLMHINTKYFQDTDETDFKQFFLMTLADPELTPFEEIEKDLAAMQALQQADEPEADLDKTGCKMCPAHDYCWKDIPKGSVFEVFRGDKARQLIHEGMPRVQDLPPDSFNSANYNHWVEVYRTGKPYIDHSAIAQWLNQLEYPLYYLDFETGQPVIPLWKYSRPYQQIPFQFSLHVQEKPNGEFVHYEYLFDGKQDPRYGCAETLLKYIGEKGSIIAHNATFEKGCIKYMANDLPLPQEQKDALMRMVGRFMDTADVFRRDYFHPKMRGSFSIKKVLPALVPEMTYDGMPIANGGQAMNAFSVLYEGKLSSEQKAKLRRDLLAYCEQDTWAMAKVVDVLRNSVK